MDEYYGFRLNVKRLNEENRKYVTGFKCGNTFIDNFLKNDEAINDSFGKTYIWLEDDGKSIIGFYNIGVGSIDYIDGDVRYKMGGAIHINEFAIQQKYQRYSVSENPRINVSDLLLNDCMKRIKTIREYHLGFTFVTLQSTEEGYNLYRRHNFEEVDEDMRLSNVQDAEWDCKPMYLALDIEL